MAGRQHKVRFPLYASYALVYLSNSFCSFSGNSSVSFLNVGQNCEDKINNEIPNGRSSKKWFNYEFLKTIFKMIYHFYTKNHYECEHQFVLNHRYL